MIVTTIDVQMVNSFWTGVKFRYWFDIHAVNKIGKRYSKKLSSFHVRKHGHAEDA